MSDLKLMFLYLLIPVHIAFANPSTVERTNRKPNQIERSTIRIRVVYGERTTFFVVYKVKNGGKVEFSNNLGARETKEISAGDHDYLKLKVSSLSGTNNEKRFCLRNFIEVKTDARELVGCIGATNKLAKGIQHVTNLISTIF
ncbi:MAG: hypothetical protein IPJ71_11070 [Bdellovibrionales bacterium]|nr:hypothetical protein [Bdellovibrionales bacterium]